MKLFLQVEFNRSHHEGLGNLMLKYASSQADDIMGTDLNSHTEPAIADMVVRMIQQAESVFLLVHATDPNLSPGVASRVFEALKPPASKVQYAVLCGDHRTSESFLTNFDERFVKEHDPAKIKAMIRAFSGQ